MSRWQYVITFPRVAKSYVHIPSPLLYIYTYTRGNVRTQRRVNLTRERERERACAMYYVDIRYERLPRNVTELYAS